LADHGFRGVTITYDVWPDQVDLIVAESKRRGMATLAEPAFTTYPYAIHAGVSGYCATITISSNWLLLRCCWTAPITLVRALPPPGPSARLTPPRSDLAALDHIDRIIFRGSMLNRQSLLEARDKK